MCRRHNRHVLQAARLRRGTHVNVSWGGVLDEELRGLATIVREVDLPALVEFLTPRLAHFMVPRFFRILPDLPRTPTQKVQKHILRAEGVTADSWDREKAGIVLKRERLTARARA